MEATVGLLDRVKEQAATATAAAKDAAQQGQAKRAADAILRDLGAAVYAQQSGRATASTPADIDRLTAALREHETTHGPLDLGLESPAAGAAASPQAAAAGSPPPPPPTGQSV